MDPRQDGSSPKPAGPSAHGDVLEAVPVPVVAAEPRPGQIPGGSGALSLAIPMPDVVPSQALDEEVAAVGGASAAMGGGHQEEASTAAADAAARIQTMVAVNDRYCMSALLSGPPILPSLLVEKSCSNKSIFCTFSCLVAAGLCR
jgi:hypothetical protein